MRVEWNKKYTTISIYAIIVFFICFFSYQLIANWKEVLKYIGLAIDVLKPFLIGILIAYFISPMVNTIEFRLDQIHIKKWRIKSKKVKRFLSILFSYMILLAVISMLLSFIIPQLARNILDVISGLPTDSVEFIAYMRNLSIKIGEHRYYLDFDALNKFFNNRLTDAAAQLPTFAKDVIPNLINSMKSFAFGMINTVIAIIISIYLLSNKESSLGYIQKFLYAYLPNKTYGSFMEICAMAHKTFTDFFVGVLIDSTFVGIVCFIILSILHYPFALLISVVIATTNVIPYFGPFIGGGISTLFLLLIDPVKALWFILIVLALQQFDGNILAPRILGLSIGLKPIWVIFSILVFGSMFGFIGMFLGPPLFSVIKTIVDSKIDKKFRSKVITVKIDPPESTEPK